MQFIRQQTTQAGRQDFLYLLDIIMASFAPPQHNLIPRLSLLPFA